MTTRTKEPKEPKEPPSIKAIDDAAYDYVEKRDERMLRLAAEVDAHDNLLSLMREHKLESYSFDEFVVSLDSSTKAKVKRKKAPDSNGEEESE